MQVSYTGGPSLSDHGYDLLSAMLCYDPDKRLTARDALDYSSSGWFSEAPAPLRPPDMPTFPSTVCMYARCCGMRLLLRDQDFFMRECVCVSVSVSVCV